MTVLSLLRAADLTMRTPPLWLLPVLPHLLTQLCQLASRLASLGPPMKVNLTFRFLGMVLQAEQLCSPLCQQLRLYQAYGKGDILLAPPGILLIVRWTKTIQAVGRTSILPIAQITNHPVDWVDAFTEKTCASPTTSLNQPLLTFTTTTGGTILTVKM